MLLVITSLFLVGLTVRHIRSTYSPPADEQYAEVDALFHATSAALTNTLAGPPPASAPADTTGMDSSAVGDGSAGNRSKVQEVQQLTEGSGRMNINTASAAQLQRLPGIGPALARRIVDYRTQSGNFRSIEEILAVSGIGNATLERLRPLISVGTENSGREKPASSADGDRD